MDNICHTGEKDILRRWNNFSVAIRISECPL